MIVQHGEIIHVVFLQLFEGDSKRHFVGTVELCEGNLVRVVGYQFIEETKFGRVTNFVKRDDVRTRIIALDGEYLIVNVLPKTVDIKKITYKYDVAGAIRVTDGSDWHLDLSQL